MARAPYQVLIIPFMIENDIPKYAVFKRRDMNVWQFIAGGGEDGETPLESANRECFEEAGIPFNQPKYKLDSICTIPSEIYCEEYRKNWPENCYVIPEYAFAFKLENDIIKLSEEHTEYKWLNYQEVRELLKYDSNKTALTELRARIKSNDFNKGV